MVRSFLNTCTTFTKQHVKNIFIVANVKTDGTHNKLGTIAKPGDHFVTKVYQKKVKRIFYCDSLGGRLPIDFWEKILPSLGHLEKYHKTEPVKEHFNLTYSHSPLPGGHFCTTCSEIYPLQRCATICGVVATLTMAIGSSNFEAFKCFATKEGISCYKDSLAYLRDITSNNDFLRSVLIKWLINSKIDINDIYLWPRQIGNYEKCDTFVNEIKVYLPSYKFPFFHYYNFYRNGNFTNLSFLNQVSDAQNVFVQKLQTVCKFSKSISKNKNRHKKSVKQQQLSELKKKINELKQFTLPLLKSAATSVTKTNNSHTSNKCKPTSLRDIQHILKTLKNKKIFF